MSQIDYGPAPLQQATSSGKLLVFILLVLIAGGGVAGWIIYERSQQVEEPEPEEDKVNISMATLLIELGTVQRRAATEPMTPERLERVEQERTRLAERRAEIVKTLRGQGYAADAETAAAELSTLESKFNGATPWPDADSMTEEELAAHVRNAPAEYSDLAGRLEALATDLSGTLLGDEVWADANLLLNALESARTGLLAELKAEARDKVAAGDYAGAMAVFTTERYPEAMIPALDPEWYSEEQRAAFKATFHQLLQEELVYDIAVHHFAAAVTPLQEAWKGGEIAALVTLDDTLTPLFADLPVDRVKAQMERARQSFLSPFSQRFLELVRETHQHRPASADEVDAKLAAIEATLAPVNEWGLPAFELRAKTILDGYRSDFAERFTDE